MKALRALTCCRSQAPPRSSAGPRRPPTRCSSSGATPTITAGPSYVLKHHSQTLPTRSSTPCAERPAGYIPTATVLLRRLSLVLAHPSSHSGPHGYADSALPLVAARCHSHSVGSRTSNPSLILSQPQKAVASSHETFSAGWLPLRRYCSPGLGSRLNFLHQRPSR